MRALVLLKATGVGDHQSAVVLAAGAEGQMAALKTKFEASFAGNADGVVNDGLAESLALIDTVGTVAVGDTIPHQGNLYVPVA